MLRSSRHIHKPEPTQKTKKRSDSNSEGSLQSVDSSAPAPASSDVITEKEVRTEANVKSNVESAETEVDKLASQMSSLKFVPPSVRFGRGGVRRGFSRS